MLSSQQPLHTLLGFLLVHTTCLRSFFSGWQGGERVQSLCLEGLPRSRLTLCFFLQLEMELKVLQAQAGPAEQSVLLSREEASELRYIPPARSPSHLPGHCLLQPLPYAQLLCTDGPRRAFPVLQAGAGRRLGVPGAQRAGLLPQCPGPVCGQRSPRPRAASRAAGVRSRFQGQLLREQQPARTLPPARRLPYAWPWTRSGSLAPPAPALLGGGAAVLSQPLPP